MMTHALLIVTALLIWVAVVLLFGSLIVARRVGFTDGVFAARDAAGTALLVAIGFALAAIVTGVMGV